MTTLRSLTETASEFGNEAKQTIEDLSSSAGRKADHARGETGRVLHSAASTLRDASSSIDNLASGAAKRLDATASYVERHDFTGMMRSFGRKNLGASLIVAAACGFLAGSALSRTRRAATDRA